MACFPSNIVLPPQLHPPGPKKSRTCCATRDNHKGHHAPYIALLHHPLTLFLVSTAYTLSTLLSSPCIPTFFAVARPRYGNTAPPPPTTTRPGPTLNFAHHSSIVSAIVSTMQPVDLPSSSLSPGSTKADLLHPSFLPACEHGKDGGEMHAHAFGKSDLIFRPSRCASDHAASPLPCSLLTTPADLLSLAATTAGASLKSSPPLNSAAAASSNGVDASSVPTSSYLSSTRPPNGTPATGSSATQPAKARRMSSSTTGVLGRGKLGLTGDPLLGKDVCVLIEVFKGS